MTDSDAVMSSSLRARITATDNDRRDRSPEPAVVAADAPATAIADSGGSNSSDEEASVPPARRSSLQAHSPRPGFVVPFKEEPTFKDYLFTKTTKKARKAHRRWADRWRSYSFLDWLGFVLPCVQWLRVYDIRKWMLPDFLAGISVGAMVIPQGMSYAQLAGLPSVYGLYGSFIPVWVYSALGSSRQLAVGPVAVTSLLLFTGANEIFKNPNDNFNDPHDPEAQATYNKLAIQVAFIAGVMYTLFGILRLGWLTNLLSHAVVAGFTTGAAIIIGMSQAKYVFGYSRWYKPDEEATCSASDVCECPDNLKYDAEKEECYESFPRNKQLYSSIADLIKWHSQFEWREFVMALSWIIILLTCKELGKRFKRLRLLRALGPLTVLVLSIAITNIFNLEEEPANIDVVGEIQRGFPDFTGGWITSGFIDFSKQFSLAALICLIDVMESTAIATTLALKNNYQLNYTQELTGLGLANVAGSLFNCYTTTGSFSRSAVNNDVGAKTPLAQFISATLVLLVLLLITPAFTNLPLNATAAIVISAVVGLVDTHSPRFYWRVNKVDLFVFLVACTVTLFVSVEMGLIVAIALSLMLILLRVSFPHTAELGELACQGVYRNVKQYPEAKVLDGILMTRWDSPLYFANVRPIRDRLEKYERRAEERCLQKGGKLRYVIVDLSPVTDIDGTAAHWLEQLIDDHKRRNVELVFANPSRVVSKQMVKAKLPARMGTGNIFVRMADAVEACKLAVLQEEQEAKAAEV